MSIPQPFVLTIALLFCIGGCSDSSSPISANSPPTLTLIDESKLTQARGTALITYVASDPDDQAIITFFADYDNKGFDGWQIGTKNENDETAKFSWDVTSVADGLYYVYGVIDDGTNQAVKAGYRGMPIVVFSTGSPPPYITIASIENSGTGNVTVNYDIWTAGLSVYAIMEYRGGSAISSWVPATMTNPGILWPAGRHRAYWEASIDEAGITANDYQIRLHAEIPGGLVGPPAESDIFSLSN
jgi:hypothetical protein